jgi:hypothetical protein
MLILFNDNDFLPTYVTEILKFSDVEISRSEDGITGIHSPQKAAGSKWNSPPPPDLDPSGQRGGQ